MLNRSIFFCFQTNNVNNTNGSPIHSIPLIRPRSFGLITEFTNTPKTTRRTMLPEASYFTDRRYHLDFDRIVNHDNGQSDKNCFGFDMNDDIELESASKTESMCQEVKSSSYSSSASAFNDARAKLKRFLRGSNPNSHLSVSNQLCEKANNKQ